MHLIRSVNPARDSCPKENKKKSQSVQRLLRMQVGADRVGGKNDATRLAWD